MKMPESIKIGWRKYKITEDEKKCNKRGQDVYAEIIYEENSIYVYEKLDNANKKVSLLHEILHGIGYMIGNKSFREDEEIITSLSENLYHVFKDNPDLIKYLGSDEDEPG